MITNPEVQGAVNKKYVGIRQANTRLAILFSRSRSEWITWQRFYVVYIHNVREEGVKKFIADARKIET